MLLKTVSKGDYFVHKIKCSVVLDDSCENVTLFVNNIFWKSPFLTISERSRPP